MTKKERIKQLEQEMRDMQQQVDILKMRNPLDPYPVPIPYPVRPIYPYDRPWDRYMYPYPYRQFWWTCDTNTTTVNISNNKPLEVVS